MAFLSGMKLLTLFPSVTPDFNYNTDGYEADGAEDVKSQDGSETLPYIDESPTMSPQLCMPQGPDGGTVSPTPPEGLLAGVRSVAVLHASTFRYIFTCICALCVLVDVADGRVRVSLLYYWCVSVTVYFIRLKSFTTAEC